VLKFNCSEEYAKDVESCNDVITFVQDEMAKSTTAAWESWAINHFYDQPAILMCDYDVKIDPKDIEDGRLTATITIDTSPAVAAMVRLREAMVDAAKSIAKFAKELEDETARNARVKLDLLCLSDSFAASDPVTWHQQTPEEAQAESKAIDGVDPEAIVEAMDRRMDPVKFDTYTINVNTPVECGEPLSSPVICPGCAEHLDPGKDLLPSTGELGCWACGWQS